MITNLRRCNGVGINFRFAGCMVLVMLYVSLGKEGDISISGYTLMTVDGKPAYTEVAYISDNER